MGDETRGYINYAGLAEDVKPGDRILIDDGLIELHVRESMEQISSAGLKMEASWARRRVSMYRGYVSSFRH